MAEAMRLNAESRALLADSLRFSLAPAKLDGLEQFPEKFLRRVSRTLGNWILGLFGCPHQEMSRPFSRHGEIYRVCIGCGVHRRFDPQTWDWRGPFYFEPGPTAELLEINARALQLVSSEEMAELLGVDARGVPERDPILKFIGGVSHGSLAHDIDRELYGN
jgi:hypothetical protein